MLALLTSLAIPQAAANSCGPSEGISADLRGVLEVIPFEGHVGDGGDPEHRVDSAALRATLAGEGISLQANIGHVEGTVALDEQGRPLGDGSLWSVQGGAAATVADVQLSVGDETNRASIGVALGGGFEQGQVYTDRDGDGIPEHNLTRWLGPMRVGLTYEVVDAWMTRARWRELERQAAAEANAEHGWFWPSRAKADFYRARLDALVAEEVARVRAQG